jgi:hypothetical protein
MSLAFSKGQKFLPKPSARTEPPLPSAIAQALNFGKSIYRAASSVAHGNPLKLSEATVERRREICNACEFYRASDGRCSKCGCPTSNRGIILSKTELFSEFCPVGKWGPGEIGKSPDER